MGDLQKGIWLVCEMIHEKMCDHQVSDSVGACRCNKV